MKRIIPITVSLLLIAFLSYAQTPPKQPNNGPAGSNYSYDGVTVTKYGTHIHDCYWILEPNQPKPDSTELIVVWHGTTKEADIDKVLTNEWPFLKHLVRKGYSVIYPLYQYEDPVHTLGGIPQLNNAIKILKTALDTWSYGGHTPIKLTKEGNLKISATGGSRGGTMSLKVSSKMVENGMPAVQGIVAVVPGIARNLESLSSDTKVLIINSDSNDLNYTSSAKNWKNIDHISCGNKRFIEIQSDSYGTPVLLGDHAFGSTDYSNSKTKLDAMDYYGSWKFTVALFNCLYRQKHCGYCLDNEEKIKYMGKWSDGTKVAEAVILDSCGFGGAASIEQPSVVPSFIQSIEGTIEALGLKNIKMELFNLNGVLVRQSIDNKVSTRDLPKGMYVLLYSSKEGRGVEKVVLR